MATLADAQNLATRVLEYYYQNFMTNRSNLGILYRDNSMLHYGEDPNPTVGRNAILEKLTGLGFQRVEYRPTLPVMVQKSDRSGGIIVMVTGVYKTDDDRPQSFAQTFHLIPEGDSCYIENEVFRIVFPAPDS